MLGQAILTKQVRDVVTDHVQLWVVLLRHARPDSDRHGDGLPVNLRRAPQHTRPS